MKSDSFATYTIRCEVTGFSRSVEIPLDGRGYARSLADDLDRALELYALRIENHRLKQELEKLNVKVG